jgi:hypothetical protein
MAPLRQIVGHEIDFDSVDEVLICGHVLHYYRSEYRRALRGRRCFDCALEHYEALRKAGKLNG